MRVTDLKGAALSSALAAHGLLLQGMEGMELGDTEGSLQEHHRGEAAFVY